MSFEMPNVKKIFGEMYMFFWFSLSHRANPPLSHTLTLSYIVALGPLIHSLQH